MTRGGCGLHLPGHGIRCRKHDLLTIVLPYRLKRRVRIERRILWFGPRHAFIFADAKDQDRCLRAIPALPRLGFGVWCTWSGHHDEACFGGGRGVVFIAKNVGHLLDECAVVRTIPRFVELELSPERSLIEIR